MGLEMSGLSSEVIIPAQTYTTYTERPQNVRMASRTVSWTVHKRLVYFFKCRSYS